MNDRSHRRELNLAPALLDLGHEPPHRLVLGAFGRRAAHQGETGDACDERRGVDGDRAPRPGQRDQHARQHGTQDHPGALGHAYQCVGLLQVLGRHHLRDQAPGGGAEERLGRAVDRGEHRQVPDLGDAGDQDRGGRGLRRGAHQV